jgi:hypothetical protein
MPESNALDGVSNRERETMLTLLRKPTEQHKESPRPKSRKGEAQRRRREAERQASNDTEIKPNINP